MTTDEIALDARDSFGVVLGAYLTATGVVGDPDAVADAVDFFGVVLGAVPGEYS